MYMLSIRSSLTYTKSKSVHVVVVCVNRSFCLLKVDIPGRILIRGIIIIIVSVVVSCGQPLMRLGNTLLCFVRT